MMRVSIIETASRQSNGRVCTIELLITKCGDCKVLETGTLYEILYIVIYTM